MRCRTLYAVVFLHCIVQHCRASTLRGSGARGRGGPEGIPKPQEQEQEPLWKFVDLPIQGYANGEGNKIFVNDPSKVDPMIGTGGHGHTYPGATTPWGMVQATPWTRSPDLSDWDMQAGYNPDASTLHFYGMAHTSLSGAGWGEMGELRLLPRAAPGQMRMLKRETRASPGFFATSIAPSQTALAAQTIGIESSAAPRGAIHRFTFADMKSEHQVEVALGSVMGEGKNSSSGLHYSLVDSDVKRTGKGAEGCTVSSNSIGSADSVLCFALQFSRDPKPAGGGGSGDHTFAFAFDPEKTLVARVGFSRTDVDHARAALQEVAGDLEAVTAAARSRWDKALGVVRVELQPEARKRMFYTAMYHTMVAPNLLSDSDGTFRLQDWKSGAASGASVHLNQLDAKVPRHVSKSPLGQYATFSFWDTYRSLHPLLNLVHPEEAAAFGESLLEFARHWRALPEYQVLASPATIMVGDGASIVLGTMARNHLVDQRAAFEVLDRGRHTGVDVRRALNTSGQIPAGANQVSQALEQAAADSCVARLASDIGRTGKEQDYWRRANLVLRHWNNSQKIYAPISSGASAPHPTFQKVQDIYHQSDGAYTEGTALQYAWATPFTMTEMVAERGGTEKFVQALDHFFKTAPEPNGASDITGNLHGMTIGNEPCMHIPYLYAAAGRADKTQEVVDQLVKRFFTDHHDGLPGNDDMGQMSSWLVFSLLGFYPMDACSGNFILGRPFVDRAELAVRGGRKLALVAHGQGDANKYVHKVEWNGRPLDVKTPVLTFDELVGGGTLEFWMGAGKPLPAAGEAPSGFKWLFSRRT